ncbi:MAG TPA: hypothetical protein EYO61_03440 [Campylobacterales bacterium]|nr:hypothetical protein [Campylobacterales bacterium]HIO70829.1 hypothetical protein [Campylobacterales bacterium]
MLKETSQPLSQLDGQKIDPKDDPFGFLEPSADELDTFSEARILPLKQKRLPSLSKKKEPPKKESEYFQDDESIEGAKSDQITDEVANSFLAKQLAELENDVLSDTRNSVGLGVLYKTRVGSAGLDALDNFVLPSFDFHYYYNISHHFYGSVNFMDFTNGKVTGDAIPRYGDMKSGGNIENVSSLMELMAGYEYTGDNSVFTAEIGQVPSPAVVPKTPIVWLVKFGQKLGKFAYDIAYVKRSVKDSLLSRIGDKYNIAVVKGEDDPETDVNESYIEYETGVRGGVTKEGLELGAKLSVGDEVFAGNVNYYNITGYNILTNKELALTLLYLRLLDIPKFESFMVGPIFLYDNFTYNSGYFTVGPDGIGNGGYFSPRNFVLLGIYFDFAQVIAPQLFWKVKGNMGMVKFVSGRDVYNDTSSEMEISGFGYEVKGFGGYKLDNNFELLAGMGYQKSGPYQSLFFGLSAIYYFGEKKGIKVSDLANSNTLGEMAR